MKQKNITLQKSFDFVIRIVKLYQHLVETKREFVLSKQLLRSGTSVGANIREAYNGKSDADFIHKLGISQKECDETAYWIELLYETNYLNEAEFTSINQDCNEVLKIIKSIILTKKAKKNTIIHHISYIIPQKNTSYILHHICYR